MLKKLVSLFLAALLSCSLLAQVADEKPTITLQSRSLVSSGEQVPFWLQSNQLGMIDPEDSFQQLFLFQLFGKSQKSNNNLAVSYGLSLLGRLADHAVFQPVEYWSRMHRKQWYLHLGAKSEPIFADGLSLTNGNLFLSNNARPMPRIGFGATDFRLFNQGWLSRFFFDLEYNEYFLLDDRVVENANLHHKRLDISYMISPEWTFSAGLDHWAHWGGNSPEYGQLPGFEDYIRYVFGKVGSESAPDTDRNNVAGDHLGQYIVSLEHDTKKHQLSFYWQHLWEDGSGMRFENAPDGLWGVHWKEKKMHQLLESVVLEYVNTRHQSGRFHKEPDPDHPGEVFGNGRDNYFNNSVYRSGFVSYQRMIGLPLFMPGINEDGIATGFANTRMWAIHHGMGGWFSDDVNWKTQVTYSKHYGQHGAEYNSPAELFSLGAQLAYSLPQKPLSFSLKLAYDRGAIMDSGFGAEFRMALKLN